MKIEENDLFHEPVDHGLIKKLKMCKSAIIKDVSKAVEEDQFLHNRIDRLRIEWKMGDESEDPFFGHVHRVPGKGLSKDLGINISAWVKMFEVPKSFDTEETVKMIENNIRKIVSLRQELLFQLYKIPGEEKNADELPAVQRKLKKWVDKMGEDFFVLYPSYHSQLTAAGIQLGLMKNHPECKKGILNLYGRMLALGLPIKKPLYRLGDVKIEITENGLPTKSSFFKFGLARLILGFKRDQLARYVPGTPIFANPPLYTLADFPEAGKYRRDYLAHYVAGTPVFSIISILSLANDEEMGRKLKKMAYGICELSRFEVVERLHDQAELINSDTFDECLYPSVTEENYVSGVEKYLNDCVEIKRLMKQIRVNSLIKPEHVDEYFMFQKTEFLNNIRDQFYIG